MAVIRCGTTAAITRMEKANLQERQHLTRTLTLICMSISIFVAKCLRKSQRKQEHEEEVQMRRA